MKRILWLPILICALTAAVACTGDPGRKPPAGAATEDPSQLTHFTTCMREHGQHVPDPDPNSDSYTLAPPSGGPNAAWEAALQACRQYLPNGGDVPTPSATELEALRRYARCMREHGIETTDPDPDTGKSQVKGRLAGATRDQVNNDPGYKAAQQACKDKLPRGEG
jgi:hypothetical protein